jgi:hypothetical protein
LQAIINVWEEGDEVTQALSEELELTREATFPRDAEVLIAAWEKDISFWQPKFIEMTEREVALWGDLKRSREIAEGDFKLIHAIQVNRALSLSHKESYLEILTQQLAAMRKGDKEQVDNLLAETLNVNRAADILRNDYAGLLRMLQEKGLEIPENHIPQRREIRDEDYKVGNYIVERLMPLPVAIMETGLDPWLADYEDWYQARDNAEQARLDLERFQTTADWYFDAVRDMRQQLYEDLQ